MSTSFVNILPYVLLKIQSKCRNNKPIYCKRLQVFKCTYFFFFFLKIFCNYNESIFWYFSPSFYFSGISYLPTWDREVKRQRKIIHRGAFRKGEIMQNSNRKQGFHQESISMNQSARVRNLKGKKKLFYCHILKSHFKYSLLTNE